MQEVKRINEIFNMNISVQTYFVVQEDDDNNGSLNTPKHYTSITTPRALRQYTTPVGVETDGPTSRTRSPRKVKTPKYTQDSDESNDDIEDETYDEIVGVFQNKPSASPSTQVVKKVDQSILDNMNVEISKDMSDQQFNAITKNTGRGRRTKQEPVTPKKADSLEEEEHGADDPSTDDDDLTEEGNVRIIRLGTEEVKKYAILNKKDSVGLDNTDEDDDDDYDRVDREELYEDEEEAMENDPECKAYLDSYCVEKAPELTTLKVAKKYPSKQKFPCPKCPKIWNWPWELRRHLMIHFKPQKLNTANSFPCPHPGCDKKFQWKRDMKQHERIHTGEKLLVCSVCEKKFTTRQALLHHVVVHTGEKPFQCAVCGNRFTQPANLRTHVKKRHNYSVESNKQNKCKIEDSGII